MWRMRLPWLFSILFSQFQKGVLLDQRRRRCRRVGHTVVAAGRRESLQEIFSDETADEARSFNQAESAGQQANEQGMNQDISYDTARVN